MKTRSRKCFAFLFFIASVLSFTACDNDDPKPNNDEGQVSIKLTDAPIDNSNVKGVFVTVADVKVDGKSFDGFSGKQTIDLLAYQNGNAQLLGTGSLDAGAYSNITLVLDYESDVHGDDPGCYVLTLDGTKHSLGGSAESSADFVASGAYEIAAEIESDIVIDFDVRKAVRSSSSGESNFNFASSSGMQSALRVVQENKTGTIKGELQKDDSYEKVVVYAYKKGQFNADTETQAQGSDKIRFKNAVTSAVVTGGDYTLAFLEEGEYELHFIGYNDEDNDGILTFDSMLEVNSNSGINTNNVKVEGGVELTLNISLL